MAKKKYSLTEDAIKKELRRLRRSERRRKVLQGTAVILTVALVVAFYLASQRLMLVTVRGNSMGDTLESGSVVLCQKGAKPQRGELVLFAYQDALLIKRVVALGGDEVSVNENGVTVNGSLLTEPYATGDDSYMSDIAYPVRVPPDELFVMGDDRTVSVDSRSSTFGTVSTDTVLARPQAVVWPLFRAKKLGE